MQMYHSWKVILIFRAFEMMDKNDKNNLVLTSEKLKWLLKDCSHFRL